MFRTFATIRGRFRTTVADPVHTPDEWGNFHGIKQILLRGEKNGTPCVPQEQWPHSSRMSRSSPFVNGMVWNIDLCPGRHSTRIGPQPSLKINTRENVRPGVTPSSAALWTFPLRPECGDSIGNFSCNIFFVKSFGTTHSSWE